ncbi:MAG: hypothetical protein IJ680_07770 [Paludibacteraceae bacterium]|nr:hypothetical protein [Paludibacteraceae bacterium]
MTERPDITVTEYLIQFLTRTTLAPDVIGYTNQPESYGRYRLVIVPSGFLQDGRPTGMQAPELPLQRIPAELPDEESIPLLFGTPQLEMVGHTLVCHADLLASSYFLLTDYEQSISTIRDEHGRFPASASLPFRAGFLHRPIVDEYGCYLRRLLRRVGIDIDEPQAGFERISLTHDVDLLTQYHSVHGALGGVKGLLTGRGDRLKTILRSIWSVENDPLFTYAWLLQQDARLPHAEKILFVKSCIPENQYDKPGYSLRSGAFRRLVDLCQQHGATIGLHGSYTSGEGGTQLAAERTRLQEALHRLHADDAVSLHRFHFLRYTAPEVLTDTTSNQGQPLAGMTDDYSIGYAQMAGFRRGTCHAVRAISLQTGVTQLMLHPLTVMDGTLSDARYMNQDEDDAYRYCCDLFRQIHRHHGEVVLLWHNSTVRTDSDTYHRQLYPRLIEQLIRMTGQS